MTARATYRYAGTGRYVEQRLRMTIEANRPRANAWDRRQRRREPSALRSRRRATRLQRARDRGVVLPIVLLVSALMLATSAVWFETSLAAARSATNVLDQLQAFHAADSALSLCVRSVLASAADDTPAQPEAAGEPIQWKLESAFVNGAITPVAQWSGSRRAPQCLIEPWRLSSRVDARAYLVTSRGFGRTDDTQVWLQMQLVIDGGTIERHWRRVAARPF